MEKQLTSKQIETLDIITQRLVEAWKKIKALVNRVWQSLARFLKTICKCPGYKRIAKQKEISYFESISKGKSNNWRKLHGLVLIRCRS